MKTTRRRVRETTDATKDATWACLQGIGIVMCNGPKGSRRSVLVVQELHCFSEKDARALAKHFKVKVVPHHSRLVKGRPTFDGTKQNKLPPKHRVKGRRRP